jgi:hypothetical protein
MLVIRKEQMDVLADQAMKTFISRVFDHLSEVFPDQCRELGDEALDRLITDGIKRAASYGIDIEDDVVRFIELMFILCDDYDTSYRFPWARQILLEPDENQTERVDRLCELAEQELPSSAVTMNEG